MLYAVKNKSHVYRLVKSGSTWAKDTTNGWSGGKDIRFPGGAGLPDSEGLTVGPDGFLYITSERDYAAPGVPLDSILKFDPAAAGTTLVASEQWTLTPDMGLMNTDADLGLKGVAYVPDSYLTGAGFKADDGTLYKPADYSNNAMPGLFFAAVGKTGHLLAYAQNSDHNYDRVADIDTEMAGVMDVSYDPDLGRIWVACDHDGSGTVELLKVDSDGHFTADKYYNRPADLPDYDFEGFAVAPVSAAGAGAREVLWTDAGNRLGHSLWSGTMDVDLGLELSSTPTPAISGTVAVGNTLTANVGTWDDGATTSYVWKNGETVLAADAPLLLTAALRGETITLAVTGSKDGYADVTKTATTAAVDYGTQTLQPTPSIAGSAVVGDTLTAGVGTWDSGVSTHYQWLVGATVVASDASLPVTPAVVGKTLTLSVTGTRDGYTSVTKTAASAAIAAGTLTAPTPTISPSKPVVGGTLTARVGTWGPGAVALSCKWFANGAAIPGATRTTLKVAAAQAGKVISFEVTGSATGYVATSVLTSPNTEVVANGTITAKMPVIRGTAKVKSKLTVKPGAWSAGSQNVTYKYRWYANGRLIRSATKATLTLTKSRKGEVIAVKVTGSSAGYDDAYRNSIKSAWVK